MGALQIKVFLGSLLVLCTVYSGEALSCYECNSHNDSACAKDIPPVSSKIDCSTKTEGPKYNLCRKIVQFIDFEVNNNKPEKRVIRTCGWVDTNYKTTCYHRSGFGGRQEVCSCITDFCNSSQRHFVGFGTLIMFLLARLVL